MSAKSYANSIVYNPWKVLLACLVVVLSVGYFMQYVAPSISFKDLLGADNPQLEGYDFVQSEYTNDDNLLVFIEAKDGNAFKRNLLFGVKNLTTELWKTPHSIRIDSVTNYQHTEAVGDDLKIGDLIKFPQSMTDIELQQVKQIAVNEPLTVNRVVNRAGNVLAVNVSFAFPNINGDEKLNSDAFVQSLADVFRQNYPETNVYVGGLTALDATVMRISMKESGMFLGLVILVVLLLLAFILRTVKPILLSVVVFVLSVMAGMALSGMMGWKLTPFTSSVPMIILIIAVADCVHLVTALVHRMQAGEEKNTALINALRLNAKPIIITSVTTAIGFLTLNFSESQSIGALGSQSAFGVMFACFLTLTFLPAALALTKFKPGKSREKNHHRFVAIADFLYRNRITVLLISVLMASVMGYSATKNEFNDNIPTYFAKSLPWRQANDFSEEQFGGAYTFSYSMHTDVTDGVSDPKFLSKIESFAYWLRDLPEVSYVNSIADTFKRLNQNMNNDDPTYYRLPDNKELAAQYLLLYEMSLPYGLDLNNQINLDKSATKVLVTFKTMSTTEVLAMETKIDNWMRNNLEGIRPVSSSVQVMFAHLLNQDTKGLTLGAVYGLLIISLLLMFMVKSFKMGLISVLPNLVPVICAFGVWGLAVGQIGMGLAMVSGMSIGIIVDDTVHFLTKYLQARRENGMDAAEAVAYTFEEVGPAIIFTTVVLVVGFMLMSFLSEFRINSDMGKMTSIIMIFALVFDLVVLPVLLMMFDGAKQHSSSINQATA